MTTLHHPHPRGIGTITKIGAEQTIIRSQNKPNITNRESTELSGLPHPHRGALITTWIHGGTLGTSEEDKYGAGAEEDAEADRKL